MAKRKVKNGPVTIEVESHLVPPKEAGTLSAAQIKSIYRPRPGLGLACQAAAEAMENGEVNFMAPEGVTPDVLRKAGQRAEEMDLVIRHLEGVIELYKQGNLIVDAEAFTLISKVNDQVKAQGKRNKAIKTAFSAVSAYFKSSAPKNKRNQRLGG